jgi:hypothetical protein
MSTEFSCQTTDRKIFLEQLRKLSPFGEIPTEMTSWPDLGDITKKPSDWIELGLRARRRATVRWEKTPRSFINLKNEDEQITEVVAREHCLGLDYFLPMMQSQPIEVICVVWDHFPKAPRLMGHTRLGWGCLFKGKGRDYFVSPRWLEHGPWLLERRDPDVTYVQLYDLAAEGEVAWQQGRRAMERLSDGFLTPFSLTSTETHGAYSPEDHSFSIVKTDRGITPFEMEQLCLIRAKRRDHATQPVEHLRVLFTEERDARRHLAELWLREIECWTLLADGRRARLDLDYSPPPRIFPEWIERYQGLPVSGPYAAPVLPDAPPPEPASGPGLDSKGFRISLGLSTLTGSLCAEERHLLLGSVLASYTLPSLCDAPGRSEGADAIRAFAELVDIGPSSRWDRTPAEAEAALAAAPFVVDVFLPPERIGLSLPALLVFAEVLSQAPIRAADLGRVASGPGAALVGAMILPVSDVLARISALGRQDLQCAESLLELCAKHRMIVVATRRPGS